MSLIVGGGGTKEAPPKLAATFLASSTDMALWHAPVRRPRSTIRVRLVPDLGRSPGYVMTVLPTVADESGRVILGRPGRTVKGTADRAPATAVRHGHRRRSRRRAALEADHQQTSRNRLMGSAARGRAGRRRRSRRPLPQPPSRRQYRPSPPVRRVTGRRSFQD